MNFNSEIQDFGKIKKMFYFAMVAIVQFIGIMFAFNSMNLADRISSKTVVVFVFSAACAFLFGWFAKTKNSGTLFLFLSLGVCILLTSLLRFNTSDVINSVAVILSVPLLLAFFNKYKEHTDEIFVLTVLATFAAVIASLFRYGFIANNSQGVILAMCGILGLCLICMLKRNSILFFIAWVVIIVSAIAITKSRTSILGFIFVAVMCYYHLYMRELNIRNILIVLLGALAIFFMYESLSVFFEKIFFEKWRNTDLSSGRLDIWKDLIKTQSLLGHGVSGIYKITSVKDAHNSFIQTMGAYGDVAFVLLIATFVSIVAKAIKTPNTNRYTYIFIGWFFLSCFENLDVFSTRLLPVGFLFIVSLCLMEVENSKDYVKERN